MCLELCHSARIGGPVHSLTHAWILLYFIDSQLLRQTRYKQYGRAFITYAFHLRHNFVFSFCHPPSRTVKKRELSHTTTDKRFYELGQHNTCNEKQKLCTEYHFHKQIFHTGHNIHFLDVTLSKRSPC